MTEVKTTMRHSLVDSANIASVGYDDEKQVLEVLFKNDRVYQYFDVPSVVVDEFVRAESKGTFFARSIRGKFEARRVDG